MIQRTFSYFVEKPSRFLWLALPMTFFILLSQIVGVTVMSQLLLDTFYEWGSVAVEVLIVVGVAKVAYDTYQRTEAEAEARHQQRLAEIRADSDRVDKIFDNVQQRVDRLSVGVRDLSQRLVSFRAQVRVVLESNARPALDVEWAENKADQLLKDVPTQEKEDLICPITREIMMDPVIADDGKSYDRWALQAWYDEGHHTCPLVPSARLSDPRQLPSDENVMHQIRALIAKVTAENASRSDSENVSSHWSALSIHGASSTSASASSSAASQVNGSASAMEEGHLQPNS